MEDPIENFDTNEEESYEEMQIVVDKGQSAIRLDHFLVSKFSKISRNRIQNSIDAGLITLNGKTVKRSHKLSGLEQINVRIPKLIDHSGIIPENIPLDIIFEDESLMVINKQPGMIVHPAAGVYTGTLVNALAYHFRAADARSNITEKERFGLVHRIDKETSGLLVISKSDFVHAHLSKQFFDHSIQREYYALVWGEPSPISGTITANIGRDPKHRQRQFVFADGLEGKNATTHYELIESYYYTSLVRCVLETGRTHQIRVHMKYIGNPLFNDEKYGGDKIVKGTIFNKYKQFVLNCYKLLPRFALHARSLGFIHPVTNKALYFEIDMPADFKQLLDKWRHYTSFRKDLLNDEEQ
ncbi:MAG: RluA family pseudouridine synthase [Saprospiraceae bacterium]|nr:RluA family pseudouridine synthase [Saprospiraceae bacterium]MBK8483992.1 RluA family pseudouridine synthase [Saprospiraceae bacterium]MBK9221397.1 RluA family pseudouridine synthase [Saprospiraceae bacterium]MBK9721665.1 RluA family pseudouridine synthase [Saprospiraceae bacterium]MBK9728730.1 RluA family pseudouridine synthase [Saprospiraceae bacterium]